MNTYGVEMRIGRLRVGGGEGNSVGEKELSGGGGDIKNGTT